MHYYHTDYANCLKGDMNILPQMSTEDSETYAHLEKNHFPRWKCLLQTQDSQRKAQRRGYLCLMVLDPSPCYLPWCCKRETKVPEDLVPFSDTTFRPIPMQAFQGTLTSYFLPSLRWPHSTRHSMKRTLHGFKLRRNFPRKLLALPASIFPRHYLKLSKTLSIPNS